jgi:predicted ATPase
MLHAVASQLGVRVHGQMPLRDAIVDWLQGRRFLLVLDNCEHVLAPAADLSAAITAWCPSVTVLATSREALNVAGEHGWRLSPLEPVEAAELFMDRARAADPDVTDATDHAALVRGICGSLDGIPLAIELAAARLRVMALADVAERVSDRFELLRHGPRNVLERQQTLKATVQWSYDLLTDDERTVFDGLGVCVGGLDTAAAAALSGMSSTAATAEIVGSLVEKSILAIDRGSRPTRFRLLETLRQFAEQQLRAKATLDETRHRHLAYYTARAETGWRSYEGDDQAGGVAIFTAEWDNLRAAFRCAVDRQDAVKARIFLRSLLFFSWMDARHELGEWAEQLIRAGMGDTLAYGVAAFFAVQRGAHDDGIAVAAQGLRLASHGGTDDWVCWYATTFGHYYSARVSEGREAEAQLDRAADARREPCAAGKAVLTMAAHAAMFGTQSAEEYLSRGRHLAAVLRNTGLERDVEWAAGHVARHQRRLDEARRYFTRAMVLGQQLGERFTTGESRWWLAAVAIDAQEPGASAALRDALAELWTIRAWQFWMVVEAAAFRLLEWDRAEAAAVVLGHLEARGIRHGVPPARRRQALDRLQHLSESAAWMRRGAELERDQIVSYLLAVLGELGPPPGQPETRPPAPAGPARPLGADG